MPTPYSLEPIEEEKKSLGTLDTKNLFPKKETEGVSPEKQEGAVEREKLLSERDDLSSLLKEVKKSSQTNSSLDSSLVQKDVDEISEISEEGKITKLVSLAKEKGLDYAFEVALRHEDLYTIDKLHDTLSGKLYDELVQEGLIVIEK
ncbi:MAG: hypothetical protein EOM19_03490 [Candidatus Moranbacteria bacterium]|nr:hypothetical protein [Candidatus Moranbacteria bacterium]